MNAQQITVTFLNRTLNILYVIVNTYVPYSFIFDRNVKLSQTVKNLITPVKS